MQTQDYIALTQKTGLACIGKGGLDLTSVSNLLYSGE
jgi:hypothetical protein